MEKNRGPIDFIKDLTERKTPWEDLSETDKKGFSQYIINLFLSMNPDLLEFVNDLQRYTIGGMTSKQVYKLYLDLLPKMKLPYCKFIKGKKDEKYNGELVQLIANHMMTSEKEAQENIEMFFHLDSSGQQLQEIIRMYGNDEKAIKKLLKIS